MNKTIVFKGWECSVDFGEYQNGGTAIQLFDVEDGCPIAVATVWITGLKKDEIAIKDYSENSGMLDALLDAGIVMEPHRYQESGFVTIPICRLNKELVV